MPHQAHLPPNRLAVRGQVDAEDGPRPGFEPEQAGTEPQQRGLARTVGTLEQDDLTRRDLEVEAGKGREGAEESDGLIEAYDGIHGAMALVERKGRLPAHTAGESGAPH